MASRSVKKPAEYDKAHQKIRSHLLAQLVALNDDWDGPPDRVPIERILEIDEPFAQVGPMLAEKGRLVVLETFEYQALVKLQSGLSWLTYLIQGGRRRRRTDRQRILRVAESIQRAP